MGKLIVTAALTGGFASKKDNPNLPTQPEEIARAAYECFNEGAAIIHLHARDENDKNSGDPAIFSRIYEKIREKCNVVLQYNTGEGAGGGAGLDMEERIKILDANPEMVPLNMGTVLRTKGWTKGTVSLNPPWEIERLANEMLKRDIKPELAVYNHSMYRDVINIIEKGLLKKPYCLLISLGGEHQGGIEATADNLRIMIDSIPRNYRDDIVVNVCAIGLEQIRLTTIAMALQYNVRVGMEDSIFYSEGILAKSNAEMVARAVRVSKELGLAIATPDEAREILKIKKK
jgi:3-keto-5-aminohexanoate cleavage enzyme